MELVSKNEAAQAVQVKPFHIDSITVELTAQEAQVILDVLGSVSSMSGGAWQSPRNVVTDICKGLLSAGFKWSQSAGCNEDDDFGRDFLVYDKDGSRIGAGSEWEALHGNR